MLNEASDRVTEMLKQKAMEARRLLVTALHESGGGHYGGCLSELDILTVLYNGILSVKPDNPKWEARDHFILSKGHGAVGLASVLALRGFFPKEVLKTSKQFNASVGWHTTLKMPGIEHPTGSLGHGLSVGVGLALAKKLDGKKSRVFVLLGDGECDEGSVWEAAMTASKYGLDNLVAIVDRNRISYDGPTEEIMPLEPFADKWSSFGWSARSVDGHSVRELWEVFSGVPFETGKPSVVIALTVKGKGISFMENSVEWHAGSTTEKQYRIAIEELQDRSEVSK